MSRILDSKFHISFQIQGRGSAPRAPAVANEGQIRRLSDGGRECSLARKIKRDLCFELSKWCIDAPWQISGSTAAWRRRITFLKQCHGKWWHGPLSGPGYKRRPRRCAMRLVCLCLPSLVELHIASIVFNVVSAAPPPQRQPLLLRRTADRPTTSQSHLQRDWSRGRTLTRSLLGY